VGEGETGRTAGEINRPEGGNLSVRGWVGRGKGNRACRGVSSRCKRKRRDRRGGEERGRKEKIFLARDIPRTLTVVAANCGAFPPPSPLLFLSAPHGWAPRGD